MTAALSTTFTQGTCSTKEKLTVLLNTVYLQVIAAEA